MGGPRGAEAIIPVPSQGQFLIAILSLVLECVSVVLHMFTEEVGSTLNNILSFSYFFSQQLYKCIYVDL